MNVRRYWFSQTATGKWTPTGWEGWVVTIASAAVILGGVTALIRTGRGDFAGLWATICVAVLITVVLITTDPTE